MTAEERTRAKAEQLQRLKPLQSNDSFLYLKELVTKKRDRMAESLAKQILATGKVDAEKVLYEKAFWDGAMSVLNRPENVEGEFDRLLKRLADQGSDS